MKTRKLIKHLEAHGCFLLKNGSKHDMYKNPKTRKVTFIPRHPTVNDYTAEAICKQLEIPKLKSH